MNDSVYMKVLEVGEGDGNSPLFTDTVSVYYRGKLINGTVFDQNYSGDLNTEVHVPTHLHCRPNSQMVYSVTD